MARCKKTVLSAVALVCLLLQLAVLPQPVQVAGAGANGKPRVLTTSIRDILVEHLPDVHLRDKHIKGRLVIQ